MTNVQISECKVIFKLYPRSSKKRFCDKFESQRKQIFAESEVGATFISRHIIHVIVIFRNVVLLIFIPFLLIFLINSIVGTTPHYFKLGLVTQDWSGTSDGLLEKCDELHRSWWSGKDAIINGTCDPESLEPLTYVCALIKSFPDEKIVWVRFKIGNTYLARL